MSHGFTTTLIVWAVPIQNFPRGLTLELHEKLKTPADMEGVALAGGEDLDLSEFYLLDDSANRGTLGLNVRSLNFSSSNTTTANLGPARGSSASSHALNDLPQAAPGTRHTPAISNTPPHAATGATFFCSGAGHTSGPHRATGGTCIFKEIIETHGFRG